MNSKINGSGEILVLIHGWGMNSNIWQSIESDLSKHFKLIIINLPGMGSCSSGYNYSIDSLVKNLNKLIPNNSTILGWSLGGQIAIAFEKKFPQRVKKLILISTTPCFVNKKDWIFGIDKNNFEKFYSQILINPKKTIHQFFLLQLHGLENIRKKASDLKENILKLGIPSTKALTSSLNLLLKNDFRKDLDKINAPTLIIYGDKDRITPPSSSKFMHQIIKRSSIIVFNGSGHIPFISDPQSFIHSIRSFMKSS